MPGPSEMTQCDLRPLAIVGATVIDGTGTEPIKNAVVVIQGKRIVGVGDDSMAIPLEARRITAVGKYLIPGLMDANVHLLGDVRLETLARHMGHYEDLIAEAAQIALRSGLTTVFDTWGPRRFLMAARDKIDAGRLPGSRIFCAGNILGFDGPFSADFQARDVEVVSELFKDRINAIWCENVGRHLMWLSPDQVAAEVRAYISKGIDFVKYASNDHAPGSFLAFSPQVQTAIVEEAHRAGLTAQAHTMSVEGLRIAVEAGCSLIQHANITGPVPIPESTLELLVKRTTAAVVFPLTKRRFDLFTEKADAAVRCMWSATDINARNLIRSGASLLMGFDAALHALDAASDPFSDWALLGECHFAWFEAMEEKGLAPMEMLKAATRNIAVAYGKEKDLGTVEAGKIADLLILDKDPLEAAANYRSIIVVIKEGAVIDRDALPLKPILTKVMEPPSDEARSFVPFMRKFPSCPMCMRR